MILKTKSRLANISIWVIVVTILVIALFFFGFLLTNTFGLKVFASNTTDFIMTLFGASLVIVICGAFLNISLNIGIIADSRLQSIDDNAKEKTKFRNKFIVITVSILVLIGGLLFLGDFLTRQKEKNNLITECEEILKKYNKSINEISERLSDTVLIKEIPSILNFLENQKKEFPNIILITNKSYNGQPTFVQITANTNTSCLNVESLANSYYPCDKNDCDYLKEVFELNMKDYLFWAEDEDYKLYYPIINGNTKFVLLLSKYQRYGKFGS